MTLQIGLSDMFIRNTKARVLLTSTDVPAPTLKAMQSTSNKVWPTIIELNRNDMQQKRRLLANQRQKTAGPGVINIALDTRYKSTRIASYSKPGTSSSQAVTIAWVTMTEKQAIIATAIEHKLCTMGHILKNVQEITQDVQLTSDI